MTVSLRILDRMSQMMVLEWSTVLWTLTSLSIFCWLTSDLFPRLMVVPQMKQVSRSILRLANDRFLILNEILASAI